MDNVHLALAVLSIAMVVGPIVGVVSLIGEKNAELMLPPELESLASGNYAALQSSAAIF